MPDATVPVEWVAQENLFYCGPASAQMILAALQVLSPATPPSWQDALWGEIKTHTGATRPATAGPGSAANPAYPTQKCERCNGEWCCWSTPPIALRKVLNSQQAAATFAVKSFADENLATDALLDTIDRGVPAIALVYGWGHWVVVEGYVHDESGAHMVAGRALNGVYIRDSFAPQSVHFITCEGWRDDYIRFVPGGQYQDEVVVISGKKKKTTSRRRSPRETEAPQEELRMMAMAPQGDSSMPIVTPAAVESEALRALTWLLKSPRWAFAFSEAKPQKPLLVQRLDQDDSYYYIVPFAIEDVVTARIILDAKTSKFIEAAGIEEPGSSLPRFVDPAAELANWHGKVVSLPSLRSRVIRPDTVGEHPVLVWRPCLESMSPFLPFYLRSVGDEFVYLRVDGERFARLTTGLA